METHTDMTASSKSYRVGIISGSHRVVRAGPQIATFVLETIKQHQKEKAKSHSLSTPQLRFELIDVASLGLPLSDEPAVPSQIHDPADYTHEHTRVWSRRVSSFDAFVFVTPQYNWGIPAGLKNAIDYLFNEWKGKPGMIVSYGGHGGDKSAAALNVVLHGIRMHVVEKSVNLTFPNREFLVAASAGRDLGLDAKNEEGPWADQRDGIIHLWTELVAKLETESD